MLDDVIDIYSNGVDRVDKRPHQVFVKCFFGNL